MNSLVVYFSKFGNTQKIAETIGEVLESEGSVQVISSDKLPTADLSQFNLVVMGIPTHRMNLPEDVRPLFKSLPRQILGGKSVAAFDTSYKMSPLLARFTAAPRLARRLRKLGGVKVVPPETFLVKGREGPLYDGEIKRAQNWTRAILKRLDQLKN
jgi:flavodoxin